MAYDDYIEEELSEQRDVDKWLGHIELSKKGLKDRHEFYLWAKKAYETRFWKGKPGYTIDDPNRQEVNVSLTFVRAMQAAHYSQDPQVVCESKFHPPQIREQIGHLAEELLSITEFKGIAKQCLVDLSLYGMAAVQTGYKSEIAIDLERVRKQEEDASRENEQLMDGESVKASPTDDHDTHRRAHKIYFQAISQQYANQGEAMPDFLVELFQEHDKSHGEVEAANPKTTNEYIKNREVWANRLKVVDDVEPLFGWEHGKPFKTARFVWRQFYRPVAEVKRDEQLNANRAEVKATASFNKDLLPEDTVEKYGSDFTSETKLVRMWEIWDRGANEHIVIADQHPKFLRKITHPHKDILKGLGVHVVTLIDNSDGDQWMSPLEAAAPQIVTINRGESIKCTIMNKSVPFKAYNKSIVKEDVNKFKGALPGSFIGVNYDADKPLGNAFHDFQGFTITPEMMAASQSAQAWVGQLLGISDAARGGSENSKTASAAQIVSGAITQIMGEWASRLEDWIAGACSDFVQYAKNFYDERTLTYTVGPFSAKQLGQAFTQMGPLRARPERLRVKSGTTMEGIRATLQQNIMALLQTVSTHPLVHQREVLEEAFKAFGLVPDRFLISEQQEAERAKMQPGSQEKVVGGPDIQVSAPVQPGAGAPQSGAELQRAVKSQANKRAAELGGGE